MSKIYVGSTEIGSFNPQTVGTSGNILVDGTVIGTFKLPSGSSKTEVKVQFEGKPHA